MKKTVYPILILLMYTAPCPGQQPPGSATLMTEEQADTVFRFKFLNESDHFFVPFDENGVQLEHLLDYVYRFREQVMAGGKIHVRGYSSALPTKEENLASVKLRSNRVKSELITRKGMKEEYFITRNFAEPYKNRKTAVVVFLDFPTKPQPEAAPPAPAPVPEPMPEPPAPSPEPQPEPAAAPQPQPEIQPAPRAWMGMGKVALRANLLHWATLTPELGLEWKPAGHFGILVHGAWTKWQWKHSQRQFRLWKINPEARYYYGDKQQWYTGLEFHTGEYCIKLGETGRQGDFIGGGVTAGYLLPLGNRLGLDFNIGIGGTHLKYDKYIRYYGENAATARGNIKNVFGVSQAGVVLVWKLN